MKTSAAFALGLWTGAVVVGAVSAFNWYTWGRAGGDASPRLAAELQAKEEELQRVQREMARLTAEYQRQRETIADLKGDLSRRSQLQERRQARRIPYRREPTTKPDTTKVADWIIQTVLNPDSNGLRRLESAVVLQNDLTALEAVALVADRDNGETLMRIVNTTPLAPAVRAKAVEYIAATLETHPRAEEWLRGLLATGNVDAKLLAAFITGVGNPAFPSSLAMQDARIATPPHYQPDYVGRLRFLDSMAAQVDDENLRALIDQARTSLQSHPPADDSPPQ